MIVDKSSQIKNSMGAPSRASFVITIKKTEEIREAIKFAQNKKLPLIPLGEGTNIIPQNKIRAVILYMQNKGIEINGKILKVQAGEDWDKVVNFAVSKNLVGIEALSLIPGKAGSAPIQNIGAYGTEISEVLEKVYVYNREKNIFEYLKKEDCKFSYRESIFKKRPDKYIVCSIEIKLNKRKTKIPKYKDILEYFENRHKISPNLKEIREAIIKIRKNKLPDYKKTPNAGSYFTNPLITKKLFRKIKKENPDIPYYEVGKKIKIPTGWLIERTGLKGKWIKNILIYKKNALVLTNPKKVSASEILKAEKIIKEKIFKKFGILIEREPILIK